MINKVMSFIERTNYHDIPVDAIDMAKRCLLDFIGAAYAGYQSQAASIAEQSKEWLGGEQNCTVIGADTKASPLAATFINGTLGSCLDIDDGHREAVGHPAVMVIPPILACGEMVESSTGKDLLTALVVGYEVGIRCGIVMNSNHGKLFYGSGGWGTFGSAAGAAKMLRLTGEKLKNALTIGEVYGPTAQCGKSIEAGAMTKESVGWGAVTGLFGTMMARSGFTGPNNILMDQHLYGQNVKDAFQSLGKIFEIEHIYFKRFPSCKWSHSPITAAIEIKRTYKPRVEDIDEVIIETFSKALTLNHQSPETSEAAQYSIPYTVAAALCYGKLEPSQISAQYIHNHDILELAQKVQMVSSEKFERLFPEKRPCSVTVKMKNGESYKREVHVIKGDPEDPLTWHELVDKFHDCSAPYLDKKDRMQIVEYVRNLENLNGVKDLTEKLSAVKSKVNS
ncbi:MmgE/PrpD family protein [Siminovitchia sediminis]|uniref:MmgE/PrpD family protein n=1 Tax=Siminovitchia sediminis TaxID=1274353 RepID=A0ABW4KGK9_9BACI